MNNVNSIKTVFINIFMFTMDQMTVCNAKRVAGSLEVTSQQRIIVVCRQLYGGF